MMKLESEYDLAEKRYLSSTDENYESLYKTALNLAELFIDNYRKHNQADIDIYSQIAFMSNHFKIFDNKKFVIYANALLKIKRNFIQRKNKDLVASQYGSNKESRTQ